MADPRVWRNVQPVVHTSLKYLLEEVAHLNEHTTTAVTELVTYTSELEQLKAVVKGLQDDVDELWRRPPPAPPAPPPQPKPVTPVCVCQDSVHELYSRLQRVERDIAQRFDDAENRNHDYSDSLAGFQQVLAAMQQNLHQIDVRVSSIGNAAAAAEQSAAAARRSRTPDGHRSAAASSPQVQFAAAASPISRAFFSSTVGGVSGIDRFEAPLYDFISPAIDENLRSMKTSGKTSAEGFLLWFSTAKQLPLKDTSAAAASQRQTTSAKSRPHVKIRQTALVVIRTTVWCPWASRPPSKKALRLAICVNGTTVHVSATRAVVTTHAPSTTGDGRGGVTTCDLGHSAPFCEFARTRSEPSATGVNTFVSCGRCGGCMAVRSGEERLPSGTVTLDAECSVFLSKGATVSVKLVGDGAPHAKVMGGVLGVVTRSA